jgi:Glyoxalase-like domain
MPGEGFYIDHVIYGAVDIDATAARFRRDFGLGSVPGGNHLGGTTNLLIPLAPPTFLELIGIGDTSLGDGAWLSETLAGRDRVLWWVLGVDHLEETARRRGLPIQTGTMAMSDGATASFRTAGMPRYPLPFFVAYNAIPAERLRLWQARYRAANHDCDPGSFTFAEVAETLGYMDGWLGDHELPIRHSPTPGRGIRKFGIATPRGEIVIE